MCDLDKYKYLPNQKSISYALSTVPHISHNLSNPQSIQEHYREQQFVLELRNFENNLTKLHENGLLRFYVKIHIFKIL